MHTHIQNIRQLLQEGKLSEAIKEFLKGTKSSEQSDLFTNAISLSARFNDNEKDRLKGIIDDNNYNIEKNRISHALLEWLKEFEPSNDLENPVQLAKTIARQ